MAHELEMDETGGASMISVRETPWHQKGIVLPMAPGYEQALTLAKLDYTVEKRQTHLVVPSLANFGETKHIPTGAYVTYRPDTQKELGVVEHRYHVVQNTDAFRILVPLLDAETAAIETAGVLRDGADAWMLLKLEIAKFPSAVQEAFEGHSDRISPYILVANNHNGRRGILVALTAVRVVCANTLGAAENAGVSDQIMVRHTESAEQALLDAAQTLWGDVIQRYTLLAEAYERLRQTYLTPDLFQRLVVDAVAPDPTKHDSWTPEAKMADSVVARYLKRKEALEELWISGSGHTGDHSSWEAYNSAVEAVDHRPDLFPVRGGVYRTASLLDGALRKKKTDVFGNLMAHAKRN